MLPAPARARVEASQRRLHVIERGVLGALSAEEQHEFLRRLVRLQAVIPTVEFPAASEPEA